MTHMGRKWEAGRGFVAEEEEEEEMDVEVEEELEQEEENRILLILLIFGVGEYNLLTTNLPTYQHIIHQIYSILKTI